MCDDDKQFDSMLLQEPSFHGYLPREDLCFVLQQHGDYVLRLTEVTTDDKRRKELVVAVLIDPEGKCTTGPVEIEAKEAMIKNVIVSRVNGNRFAIEAGYRFEGIQQLLRHYALNSVRINSTVVQMARAVKLMRWEYSHRDVSVGKMLGKGAFGEVHKGTLKKKNGKFIPVAIKTLRTNSATVSRAVWEGSSDDAQPLPSECGQDLRSGAVRTTAVHPSGAGKRRVTRCISQAARRDNRQGREASDGHGRRLGTDLPPPLRDIASRNCLYDEDKNVKISDFGLSRPGTLYRMKTAAKMPIKWMAPESIAQFIFSQKTDVYSCGVLIYEIFACKESFDGFGNTESKQRICDSKWNEFPEETPLTLICYVQEKMWEKDPAKRATMQHISQWMERFTGLSMVWPEDATIMTSVGTSPLEDVRSKAKKSELTKKVEAKKVN